MRVGTVDGQNPREDAGPKSWFANDAKIELNMDKKHLINQGCTYAVLGNEACYRYSNLSEMKFSRSKIEALTEHDEKLADLKDMQNFYPEANNEEPISYSRPISPSAEEADEISYQSEKTPLGRLIKLLDQFKENNLQEDEVALNSLI